MAVSLLLGRVGPGHELAHSSQSYCMFTERKPKAKHEICGILIKKAKAKIPWQGPLGATSVLREHLCEAAVGL